MNTTLRFTNMFKKKVLQFVACGVMCVTGAYAQTGDIIGFYSTSANSSFTTPGSTVEVTIRLYGTIVVSDLLNVTYAQPQIRMEVGSEGSSSTAYATLIRSRWTSAPFDPFNRTDLTFAYTIRPGDMADPLKIYGTPQTGFTIFPNQCWIYKAYPGNIGSNVMWRVNNNLYNAPGNNGLDDGMGIVRGNIDLSGQNISIQTLSFDESNSTETIIARQVATLWRIRLEATNTMPVKVMVWTPNTNVLQIGSIPNQSLEVTFPVGSDYADFAIKGLDTNAIPTLATVYAQRPSDYAKNDTAVLNFISRQVTIEPPGPPTIGIEFPNGQANVTIAETNVVATGSFRIVLSEANTNRVYVNFAVAHLPSTITNIVLEPQPDGYYVDIGQDKSGWYTFSAVNGTRESSRSPYVRITPIATNTVKYALSSPGILNLANVAPSVIGYFPPTGDENTPVTFEWEELMDVDADMAKGITFAWDFGDGARVTQMNYTTQGSIYHTYSNIGDVPQTYTVALTVIDADGGSFTLPAHTITISPAPKPGNISVVINRADAKYPEGDTTAKYKVVLSQPALQDTTVELKGLYIVGNASSDNVLGLTVTNNIIIPQNFTNSVWFTMNITDGTPNSANGIKIVPTITNASAIAQYPIANPGVLYIKNIAPAIDTVPTCQPTTSAKSPYNAIELFKPFAFRYSAADVNPDKTGTPPITVEFQFDDGTTKTSIGATGPVTNTFNTLGRQTVTMVARDKDGGETTLAFPIMVIPPLPPPSVTVVDYPIVIAENDSSAKQLTIQLSQTPASAGQTQPVVVYLDVTPTNSALNGAVTIPASVTFYNSESTKHIHFTVQDGTPLSASGGFTVTPRIAAGASGSSVYTDLQPGQVFVQNMVPICYQPIDGSTNTVATIGQPRSFSWSVRDVTADLTGMQLLWDWGDGTTSTTTGTSGTTTHTYSSSNPRVPVTVRATDKEGAYSIITFYVNVQIIGVDPSANPSAIFISFDAQGGAIPVPVGYWLLNGMEYPYCPNTSRPGYTFDWWWTTPGWGGSPLFSSVVNVTDPSRLQIFYAKWRGNSYTLNFDGYETLSQIVQNGYIYGALPLPSPTDHYSFEGWYTGTEGTGVKITSNTVVNILSNQTLYAHWVNRSFLVTFDPQGGSVTPATKSVLYQDSYATLPLPIFEDAAFNGWWTEPNGKGTPIAVSTVTAASNHTLYAKWDINSIVGTTGLVWRTGDNAFWFPQGAITNQSPLAMQSGDISDNETSWIETVVSGPCIVRFKWRVDSEETFDQLGFKIDSEVKAMISGKDQPWTTNAFTLPAGEHNLRWEYTKDESESVQSDSGWLDQVEVVRLSVFFDAQGGVVNPNSKIVFCGTSLGELPVATLANATMAGWWTLPNGKGTRVTSNTVVQTYENFTVYAKWDINSVLGTSNWVWSTDGNGGTFWFPEQSIRSVDQHLAMQAGGISHNESTWIETTILEEGTLSFNWAISAEINKDVMVCTTNGGHFKTLSSKALSWCQESIIVPKAPLTIRWTFSKDASTHIGTNSAWIASFSWMPRSTSPSFEKWSQSLGLAGTVPELFVQDRNADGVQNVFEYAFGTNLPLNSLLLNIRFVNGKTIVEIPRQDEATLPYVDVRLRGSTNLLDWTLPMIPATDTTGKPAHRSWHEPDGTPPAKAFFKLEAELK